MLTAKKKIAVREVTAKPTLASQWDTIRDFYELYSKYILGGAAIVAAVIIFAYVYSAGKQADEKEASRQFRQVAQLVQQQQYKIAIAGDPTRGIPGLKSIVDKYSGTPSGTLAAIDLGTCYLYTEQFDDALAAFDEASPSSDLMTATVFAGKAASHEGKKQYAEAATLYEKAAKAYENDVLGATYFFDAGRMYCLTNEKEKALQMLKKVEEFNTPRYEQDVQRLIAQYGLEKES